LMATVRSRRVSRARQTSPYAADADDARDFVGPEPGACGKTHGVGGCSAATTATVTKAITEVTEDGTENTENLWPDESRKFRVRSSK
jgi:hypothetical protein